MTFLSLNFSTLKQRSRRQSNIVLIVVLMLISLGLLVEEQRISTNVTEIENSIAISQGRKPIKQAQPTERDMRMLKVASVVQKKLNFPWQDLLSSLEVVKKSAPKIKLMTIQPNPTKGDVLIGAEAVDLPTMLNFIDLLKEQPVFQDVLLVNQRHLGLNNKKRLSFTLKMRWKI